MEDKLTDDASIRRYLDLSPEEKAKRYKRTSDAAAALQVSARTVRDRFYAGQIRGFYLGPRLLLIDMESVRRDLLHCNQEKV